MEAKLTVNINGRDITVPVELSQDNLGKILFGEEEENNLTGWEAPQIGQMGYYEDEFNQVVGFEVTEESLDFANDLYENDNFFTTEETAKNTIRADNVLRRIRHYAINHRTTDASMAEGGYTITYNYQNNCLEIGATGNWLAIGDVVFQSEDRARRAINKYAKELTWYFTEGKTMM